METTPQLSHEPEVRKIILKEFSKEPQDISRRTNVTTGSHKTMGEPRSL